MGQQRTALQGGDMMASTTWMQRMARIRPAVGRLDATLLYAEALAGKTLTPQPAGKVYSFQSFLRTAGSLSLNPSFQPPNNANMTASPMVALSPQSAAPGGAIAGLIIDEWVGSASFQSTDHRHYLQP